MVVVLVVPTLFVVDRDRYYKTKLELDPEQEEERRLVVQHYLEVMGACRCCRVFNLRGTVLVVTFSF